MFLLAQDSIFVNNVLQVVGFIFLCGGLPAIINFLGCKIGVFISVQSAKKELGNSTFDKYRYCVERRDSEKRMLKAALLTRVTLFLLLFVGIFIFFAGGLNVFGLNQDTADTVCVVGFFMTLGFFAIYALRFYMNGGWKCAGRVYNSWYKNYLPPDIVITEHWERWDGGIWEKKGETREDRNAFPNFMIFLRNAFVFLIKLAMAITYVTLYILDDIYIVFRHVVFYKIAEIYYRSQAKKHYTEFIEQAADMNCFKVCNNFYTDEKLNSIAHSVHKEYQRKTIECVKNGSDNFVVFASDMSVDLSYTNSRVSKLIGSSKYGDKAIYVYEGNNCRVYVCSTDTPEPDSPFSFFAHAFPTTTTDNEYLNGFLNVPDMIGFLRLYQNVFLSLVKENLSPDTSVNLYKIDEETRTVAIVSAQLKDIEAKPLPELTEEDASRAFTDEDFYTIKNFRAIHELSLGAKDKNEPEQKSTPESKKIEDGAFSVQITECGENKIKLIEIIRKYSDRGISEVKNMLEAVPVSVLDAVSESIAADLVSELNKAGAKAEITDTPSDVAEQIIEDRKKTRQSLISVEEEEIIDTEDEDSDTPSDQGKKKLALQNAKPKKAPTALVVATVILFLGCLGLIGASIFLRVKELPISPLIYQATFGVVGLWAVLRTIAKITTFIDSASMGTKIVGGVFLSISNLFLGFILACVPFGIYISSMPQEEIEAFFKPIEGFLQSLFFSPIGSYFMSSIMLAPAIIIPVVLIVTVVLLKKLSPTAKK